jgi:hypothetical protein
MEVELYPHQRSAIERLTRQSALLWHDPRLGKTRTCLVSWAHTSIPDLVVVCPAIARYVWTEEAAKVGFTGNIVLLEGKTRLRETRVFHNGGPRTMWVLSWDVLEAWADRITELNSYAIVLDEAHLHAVNNRTKRYKAAVKVCRPASRVWIATGTPFRSSALDVHWMGRLLGPFIYPWFYTRWRDFATAYCYYQEFVAPTGRVIERWSGLKPGAEQAIMRASGRWIDRCREDEALEVPHIRRMEEWLAEATEPYPGDDDPRVMFTERTRLVPAKVRVTLEWLNEFTPRPVVIFGWHHVYMDRVAERVGGVVLSGNTPEARRRTIIADFQAGKIPILICQIKAAGLAIDLSAASHVAFGELHWSEVDHRQAEMRIRGPLQRASHLTYHYLMVKRSVDEHIWNVRLEKGSAMDRLDKEVRKAVG